MKKWIKRILFVLVLSFVLTRIIWFINERKALPPKEERVYGVSQIWKQASDFYALWELTDGDLDWDQAYETAYREAAGAKTARDYSLALKKFLANLHDGHGDNLDTRVYNPTRVWLPFVMEYMDQNYVVTASADLKNCPLGAAVETVNGMETGEYLEQTWGVYVGLQTPEAREQQLCNFLTEAGKKGQQLKLGLSLPDGSTRESRVKWGRKSGRFERIKWKEYGEKVYSSEAFEVTLMGGGTAWVEFKTQRNLSYVDEYFDQVVPLIADCDGIILDVRKNGGGNSIVGHTILESFTENPVPECIQAPDSLKLGSVMSQYRFWAVYEESEKSKAGGENGGGLKSSLGKLYDNYGEEIRMNIEIGKKMYRGRFHLKPDQEKKLFEAVYEEMEVSSGQNTDSLYKDRIENSPMTGKPVVILIGLSGGSATDTMAAEAKAAGFTLVGTRTKGATGNVIRIPAGGGWNAGISTQHSLTPDGREINNCGIEADERVEQKLEDLRNGTDTQLEKAAELLKRQ